MFLNLRSLLRQSYYLGLVCAVYHVTKSRTVTREICPSFKKQIAETREAKTYQKIKQDYLMELRGAEL